MKSFFLATVVLLATIYAAAAQFNGCPPGLCNGFGGIGSSGGGFAPGGVVVPQPTGDILLVDGVSLILQTDAASFICRAGGC